MKQIEAFFMHRSQLGIRPGLERMKQLLALLGHPERRLSAIHVAGTNGKGSTSAFLKQGLQASGYRVGAFTSPSLYGIRGYIYVDDEPISEQEFVKVWEAVYPAVQTLDQQQQHPTEFEILTAIAFFYFASHVDIAVVEAGMGGREDTTNCMNPIISIITTVAKDHTAFLGHTIAEIASHKAGIIKQGTPVVIGDLQQTAKTVVLQEANKQRAPVYQLGVDFWYRRITSANLRNHMVWNARDTNPVSFELSMYGEHQLANASLALTALKILKQQGFTIQSDKLQDAFFSVQLEGRFEVVSQQPFIIVDGAHNPAGIHAFMETLENNFPHQERQLLFAAFKDKAIDDMLAELKSGFQKIQLTTFDHPRAAGISELKQHQNASIEFVNSWEQAICEMDNPEIIYYVTGSLYFISIVRSYMLKMKR
ncbi:bifunctional folylpolyglutamate synthase/dihydrofolate synthase [Virgibacillus pantothenticus]|uniref:bifunctional folylpolyglutamate synthase/dihydrofolate synthase n=1 Tax=Virgibacillus pantothenticus TaxID=1473 RepID=UPI000986887E|nr:folylpolyglutamate synthase/dihydrofolate synthase family protein [Virgibacillus pantothenticus]